MQGSSPKLEVVLSIDALEVIVKALMICDDEQYLTVLKRKCRFEDLRKTISFAEGPELQVNCTFLSQYDHTVCSCPHKALLLRLLSIRTKSKISRPQGGRYGNSACSRSNQTRLGAQTEVTCLANVKHEFASLQH
jgi:hypothetical protein